MSGELIVPLVQTTTRHHLRVENADAGVASVELVYDEQRHGRTVVVVVTPDSDDVAVRVEVRPS